LVTHHAGQEVLPTPLQPSTVMPTRQPLPFCPRQ
jgi:hypothetical protein